LLCDSRSVPAARPSCFLAKNSKRILLAHLNQQPRRQSKTSLKFIVSPFLHTL
jgi:hypothetical protein